MNQHNTQSSDARPWGVRRLWLRNIVIAVILVVAWFVFDRVTKGYFESLVSPGEVIVPNLGGLGLIQINLVHNTGAAWGSFSGFVPVLALVTSLLCLGIALFAIYWARQASVFEMVALALVFAGGIGNLYDRCIQGYVIDFITPLFIAFPTFNVADIGVTCGVIMLALVWVIRAVRIKDEKE